MNKTKNIRTLETVWIPMPDGIQLAAKIWLPEDAAQEPVPAILEYIPYRRRDFTRGRDDKAHPIFAQAGYAAVRVDMRGSGDSDGLMLDEYTQQELQDGYDVIAWLAEQPWCDGNVGMMGKSWGAYNAFQVAAMRPPALKAILPVMGTDDRWEEDIHFRGGVMATDNFWWGAIMQLKNLCPPDPPIVGDRWRDIWKERLDANTSWIAQWAEHQTNDEMWKHGSISVNYDDVQVPVYFFGGWNDLYRDTPFRIAANLKSPCKVLIGPWAHLYPHDGIPQPNIDFLGEAIRWWDHWLKGIDTGIMDEPLLRFYLMESVSPAGYMDFRPGRWVQESAWPSQNVRTEQFWLNHHTLEAAPSDGSVMSILSPQDYGAAGGDACSFATPGDLPVDCRMDASGALQLRSAPLTKGMDILGQPQLHLKLSADQPQGFVSAVLADEAPDGSLRLMTRGIFNLCHRQSNEQVTSIIPNEEMSVTVPLWGTGYQIPAGHRLVLLIASTYWPIVWPAPNGVTLSLQSGTSVLELPVRTATNDTPRTLSPAPQNTTSHITQLSEGAFERTITTDLITGLVTHRVFSNGGIFGPIGRIRFDETGTEVHDISERIYEIHPQDPLSARAEMIQSRDFKFGEITIRCEAWSQQTATADHFIIEATCKCYEGDALFHEVTWHHKIPRNGM